MRSPTALTLTALAAASLAVPSNAGAATARIAVPCWDAPNSAWVYLTKPKVCATYEPALVEIAPITVTNLRWRKWGTKHAVGNGKGKGEAYSGALKVDARTLKSCGASLKIYARVRVLIPERGAIATWTDLPCPA